MLVIITILSTYIFHTLSLTPDNACTFHLGTRLFSTIALESTIPYQQHLQNNKIIQWNFCKPFLPSECPKDTSTSNSFLINRKYNKQTDTTQSQCVRYSSNSTLSYYNATYRKDSNGNSLIITTFTQQLLNQAKFTIFQIKCSQKNLFNVSKVYLSGNILYINGSSSSGCPMFQISSLWQALQNNKIIFGFVMIILGLQSLFFGRVMLVVTIFIAAYFSSFIVLGAIATAFIGPHSSLIAIYFALILILFTSTLLAYGITKLVNVSIFFIGAWFGFIVGALINSIFCKIFGIYSVWSLVVFDVIFIILFGLLTFKYSDHFVIVSTSLTGAYLFVRPFSWIFGGFPNQFALQQLIQSKQLNTLPWTFFLYLIFIIAIAILGAIYQFLKLRRQNPQNQVEINFVEAQIQQSVDKVKNILDNLIQRYKSDHHDSGQEYTQMKQMANKPAST